MNKRVVITGMGVVSPIGIDAHTFNDNLLSGNSCFNPEINAYEGHGDENLSSRITEDSKTAIRNELATAFHCYGAGCQYSIYAAQKAVEDAGLQNKLNSCEVPVYIGSSEGETEFFEAFVGRDSRQSENETFGFCAYDMAKIISKALNLTGTAMVVHNTCASSFFAMEAAVADIKSGISKVSLCGASDPFSLKIQSGFHSLNSLGNKKGSRPFCKDRKGIIISEGSIIFVIEELEKAKKRNRHIYAEIIGIGLSNDASHLTRPDKEGIKLAVNRALNNAGISGKNVDLVFAHGTGTVANDQVESHALFESLGERKPTVAIKSTLGHMMSAAGAANVFAACQVFNTGKAPPSYRSDPVDTDLPVHLITGEPLEILPDIILCNAFGFGGNNGSVILKQYASEVK